MLAKQYRLPSHLIPQVLKNGRRFRSNNFTLIMNKGEGLSRFTFIVPIKFDKRAVRRNYLKRQMREVIRANLEEIKPSYNIIFLVNKTKTTCRRARLQTKDELTTLLRQAKLLKSKKVPQKNAEK